MNIVENGHRLRHIRIVDCVIAIYVVHKGWGDGTPVWPSPVIIIYSSVHICLQSVESGPCLFLNCFLDGGALVSRQFERRDKSLDEMSATHGMEEWGAAYGKNGYE